eukprot:g17267.t1
MLIEKIVDSIPCTSAEQLDNAIMNYVKWRRTIDAISGDIIFEGIFDSSTEDDEKWNFGEFKDTVTELWSSTPPAETTTFEVFEDGVKEVELGWDGSSENPLPPSKSYYKIYATSLAQTVQDNSSRPSDTETDVEDFSQGHPAKLTRQEQKAIEKELHWKEIMAQSDDYIEEFVKATQKEEASFLQWKTLKPVPPDEAQKILNDPVLRKRVISSRACYRDKNKNVPPLRAKTRIVARGNQDPDLRSLQDATEHRPKPRADQPDASDLSKKGKDYYLECSTRSGDEACPSGYGKPVKGSPCMICPEGTWSSEGMELCQRCSAGSWSDQRGRSSKEQLGPPIALVCPAGTWSSDAGATSAKTCVKCGKGKWSPQTAAVSEEACVSCHPGRYNAQEGASSHLSCLPCRAGTYSSASAATGPEACVACAVGSFSPGFGAVSNKTCSRCPPGTWSDTMAANSQSSCRACPTGTYSHAKGATSAETCWACPKGTYQPIRAAGEEALCIPCAVGNYSDQLGQASCRFCPKGFYGDGFGLTACHSCPEGSSTAQVGAIRAELCQTLPIKGDSIFP